MALGIGGINATKWFVPMNGFVDELGAGGVFGLAAAARYDGWFSQMTEDKIGRDGSFVSWGKEARTGAGLSVRFAGNK